MNVIAIIGLAIFLMIVALKIFSEILKWKEDKIEKNK